MLYPVLSTPRGQLEGKETRESAQASGRGCVHGHGRTVLRVYACLLLLT